MWLWADTEACERHNVACGRHILPFLRAEVVYYHYYMEGQISYEFCNGTWDQGGVISQKSGQLPDPGGNDHLPAVQVAGHHPLLSQAPSGA